MTMYARLLMTAAVATALTGCVVAVAPTVTPAGGQQAVTSPIIQAIAPNPTAIAGRGATITFTVVAYSPTGAPLEYTWSATKGQLSATKGQMVSWAPLNQDGALEPGTATVQVIVTDGAGGVAQSAVNLTIAADGSAEAEVPPATPVPTAAPSQVPSAAPTPVADGRNGAALVLDGYNIRHHWNDELEGFDDNGDSVIQRGEAVFVDPKIKNVGTSATGDVVAKLMFDDPHVSVKFIPTATEGRAADGAFYLWLAAGESIPPNEHMPSGAYRSNDTEGWLLTVSKDCPSGHVAVGTLHMEDRYGNTWQSPFEVTIP